MKTELRAYFVLSATPIFGKANYELRMDTMRELSKGADPLILTDDNCGEVAFYVKPIKRSDATGVLKVKPHRAWTQQRFLASASLDMDVKKIKDENPQIRDISDTQLAFHLVTDCGDKFLGDLALLGNIATPGGLEISQSAVCIAGYDRQSSRASYGGELASVRTAASKLSWPPLETLPLHDVWRWGQALPGFTNGLVSGRVGRALAAASFLVADGAGGSPADLAWALMGLEALYAKGSQGLKAQIIEKSAVLLGRPTEHRRRFDGIYDYRSRFVHGDLDVPLAYCREYAISPIEAFNSEADDCLLLATAILFASLQIMAKRKWSSIEFEYALRDVSQVEA